MSLISEINNTNTQKENIKTVANNIDNKLVALGGERATDLSDVASKIESMVGQYKKYAEGDIPHVQMDASSYNDVSYTIETNCDFPIKKFFIKVENGYFVSFLDADDFKNGIYKFGTGNRESVSPVININNTEVTFLLKRTNIVGSCSLTKWIALG